MSLDRRVGGHAGVPTKAGSRAKGVDWAVRWSTAHRRTGGRRTEPRGPRNGGWVEDPIDECDTQASGSAFRAATETGAAVRDRHDVSAR